MRLHLNCLDNTAKMRRSPDSTRRLVDGTDTDRRQMCGLTQVGLQSKFIQTKLVMLTWHVDSRTSTVDPAIIIKAKCRRKFCDMTARPPTCEGDSRTQYGVFACSRPIPSQCHLPACWQQHRDSSRENWPNLIGHRDRELKGPLDDPRLAITGQLVSRGNHGGLPYRSVRVNTNWHFQFNINIAFKHTHDIYFIIIISQSF